MFAKFLKIAGILALCGLLLFGAVEIWLNRNKEMLFRKVQEVVNENLNGNLEIEISGSVLFQEVSVLTLH